MSVQSDLYTTLGTHAGLAGLVGARIYPDVAPEDAIAPRVVWQEIADVPQNGIDGHNSLDNYRIQVTSWGSSATQARAVEAQVRAAMAAATAFTNVCVDIRALGFEAETKLFGMQSDFSVWWRS